MAACVACGAENPEAARFCNGCGAPLSAGGREQRKTVTIVFCDLVGSTALGESTDPEAVNRLLTRYFERMRAIVESHGGSVEKFIGDAVVAVFGVPLAHEDDALRAVRAAAEMREGLPLLGLEGRIGVNTGEVVTSGRGTLVTGDAANVAARLEQAAPAGEVYLGAETVALAGSAVEVEELSPLGLKGKSEPTAAFRLLAVGEPAERSHGARFVGRATELSLLGEAWARAVENAGCELVTIVGEPGVGKSRLVAECLAGLTARVVQARCLSYGEGITYFPVVEVINQLAAVPRDPAAAAALGSLLGETGVPTSPEEIVWAFRKLLEQEAPLVVVFDDLQWGEETFLDLVEQITRFSSGSALLLVCLARPELGDRRPEWPVAMRLEPLPEGEVDELMAASVPAGLRERIARAAGGNPLFLTEMVAMVGEGSDDVVVPSSLKALLAARLDQLEAANRGVLERGAIEGEVFHRGAVQALDPADTQVAPRLAELVRRGLIRPARPLLPAEDGFRFCHLLIRDTAYEALPKAMRAELHGRFADWLERHAGTLVERDELAGYHLEQACRYRGEVGLDDEIRRTLGDRAARHLASASRRAIARSDHRAGANLLSRALALGIPDPSDRTRAQIELGNSLVEEGRIADGCAALDEAHATAVAHGDSGAAARAQVYRLSPSTLAFDPAEIGAECERAIEILTSAGDQQGLAIARRLLGLSLAHRERWSEAIASIESAVVHSEAAGDFATRRRATGLLFTSLRNDSTPVAAAIARCEAELGSTIGDRVLEAMVKRFLGLFCAMAGRFDEAIELVEESGLVLNDLGALNESALQRRNAAIARDLAGDRAGAEAELQAVWAYFSRPVSRSHFGMVESALDLASFYCDAGRWDEAELYASEVRDLSLVKRRRESACRLSLEARLAGHAGNLAEAERLAEAALELVETMERPNLQAPIWLAFAEVLRAAGRAKKADAAVRSALELYERKGNVAAAARVRASPP